MLPECGFKFVYSQERDCSEDIFRELKIEVIEK